MPADTAALSTLRVLADASGKGSCQSLVGRFGVGNSLAGRDTNMHSAPRARASAGGRKRSVRGREPRTCRPGGIALDGRWRRFPDVVGLGRRLEERPVPVFRGQFRRGKLTADRDTDMHIKIQACTMLVRARGGRNQKRIVRVAPSFPVWKAEGRMDGVIAVPSNAGGEGKMAAACEKAWSIPVKG